MPIQPYLFFEGRAEEALAFYGEALGAKVEFLMRVKESPEPQPPGVLPEGSGEKIMHASLRIGEAIVLVSDGRCHGAPRFEGFALSIAAADAGQAERWFGALARGGEVRVPLARTFFSPCFGMVADRFGVLWMVMVNPTS